MKPLPKHKLKARQKYWGLVRAVQDEFATQYIHLGLNSKEVTEATLLSEGTVRRFFHRGENVRAKVKPYSFLHGPYATTIFAIADALSFDIKLQKRK